MVLTLWEHISRMHIQNSLTGLFTLALLAFYCGNIRFTVMGVK